MKLLDVSTKSHPNTFAMLDDEDYEAASQWKWSAEVRPHTTYVIRSARLPDGSKRMERLHQFVMRSRQRIDHADGNGLNNQRANLRFCSASQNMWNSKARDGLKGAFWVFDHTWRWIARIRAGGRVYNLGSFKTGEAAAAAYDRAAIKLHGEFARINNVCMTDAEIEAQRITKPRGTGHAFAKLTPEIVCEIRASQQTTRALAAKFGVSDETIRCARTGKQWGHVDAPVKLGVDIKAERKQALARRAMQLRLAGQKSPAIARDMGLSASYVCQLLRGGK